MLDDTALVYHFGVTKRTFWSLVQGRVQRAIFGAPVGAKYWEARAKELGKRAVLNSGHPPEAFDAVTAAQKKLLLPLFAAQLRGDERVVLDYGCGPGRFTADLAALVKGRAIGVDVAREFFAMAPRSPAVEYRACKEGVIDLPDGSVDAIFVCLTLGGIQEPVLSATIAELRRVLRDNGCLFVVENSADEPNAPTWTFRSVAEYQRRLAFADLAHLTDYDDLGQRISVLAGTKR